MGELRAKFIIVEAQIAEYVGGHTTLWNGKHKRFEDFKISENYLIGNHNVVDFQFWELKNKVGTK